MIPQLAIQGMLNCSLLKLYALIAMNDSVGCYLYNYALYMCICVIVIMKMEL